MTVTVGFETKYLGSKEGARHQENRPPVRCKVTSTWILHTLEKKEAKCTSETAASFYIITRCKYPRAELTSKKISKRRKKGRENEKE
jgi:hypothetical protein